MQHVDLRAACKSTTSPLPAEGQYGGKALWVNMGKTKVLYLGQGSVCFRSLAKTPAACVSRAWALTPFSVVVVPVGSTRNVVASLALWTRLWSLIPASGVNGVLDRPDQWQRSQWVGRRWRWCHPSVTLGTAYPQVVVVNLLLSQEVLLQDRLIFQIDYKGQLSLTATKLWENLKVLPWWQMIFVWLMLIRFRTSREPFQTISG